MIREQKARVADWVRQGKDKTKKAQFDSMVKKHESFKGRDNSIDTKIKTTKARLNSINLSESEKTKWEKKLLSYEAIKVKSETKKPDVKTKSEVYWHTWLSFFQLVVIFYDLYLIILLFN